MVASIFFIKSEMRCFVKNERENCKWVNSRRGLRQSDRRRTRYLECINPTEIDDSECTVRQSSNCSIFFFFFTVGKWVKDDGVRIFRILKRDKL